MINYLLRSLKALVYKKYIGMYDFGLESLEAIKLVKGHTMSTPIDIATLYELVIHINKYKIEGDFVECGVWKGGSVGVMALANKKHANGMSRNFHMFDLFDDIVAPDPLLDGHRAINEVNNYLKKSGQDISSYVGGQKPIAGIYDGHGGHGSVDIVKKLLVNKIGVPDSELNFHVGLFENTVPYNEIEKIALLRLDGDWYASIKICLDHLYDKVVKGGVVIIDDYYTYDGCKKAVDEFMEKNSITYFKCYSRPQTRFFFNN